jgi:hypothetical protein
LYLNGNNGKINQIFEDSTSYDIIASDDLSLIIIYTKSDELILFNTIENKIFFQKKIDVPETYSPRVSFSEINNKITVNLKDSEMLGYEYIFLLSDDKTSIIKENFIDYVNPTTEEISVDNDFTALSENEVFSFEYVEGNLIIYRENIVDNSKEKVLSLKDAKETKTTEKT